MSETNQQPDADRPEPSPGDFDRLLALADLVENSLPGVTPSGSGTASWAVGACRQGRREELTAMLLDGHPGLALRGFRAPQHWSELALVTTGTAVHIDNGGSQAARLVWICEREGRAASILRVHGKEPYTSLMGASPEDQQGLVADVMRRALGLATAPCSEPLGVMLILTWLERLLATTDERPRELGWSEVAALHPAQALVARNTQEQPSSPEELAKLSEELEQTWTWERIRWAAATETLPVVGVTAEEASWFDAGSFARAVLGERPDRQGLVERAAGVVGADVLARILQSMGPRRPQMPT